MSKQVYPLKFQFLDSSDYLKIEMLTVNYGQLTVSHDRSKTFDRPTDRRSDRQFDHNLTANLTMA